MLSIDVCKRILGNNNDDEVKKIREFLYQMAMLQIEAEKNNEDINKENHECDNLLSCELG